MSGLESIEEEGGVEPTERVQTEQVLLLLLLLGWKMREKKEIKLLIKSNNKWAVEYVCLCQPARSFAVFS
jgi:hypothetical protein